VQVSDSSSRILAGLLEARTGQQLTMSRRWRIETALSTLLRERGIATLDELITILVMGKEPGLSNQVVEALLNNETYFFRDRAPFDLLQRYALPELATRRHKSKRLRIWSAGCSSGNEPYSIAMTLCQSVSNLPLWDAKVLATDIDTDVVEQGRRGIYTAAELSSIPPGLRAKFVEPLGPDQQFRIVQSVRSRVVFKPLNLHERWPMKGPFDVIFCRNVVIYFDKPTQCRLFDRLADILRDGGYLYIGHSESLYNVTARFRPVGQSIYQKLA
jgi:chemotaxis protein methyltransferase CheR